MIGIGIGIPFGRRGGGIDPQAQAHFDRVIADGGIIPAGLVGLNAYIKALKSVRGSALSDMLSAYEAHYLGLKTAAGVGATAGGRAAAKVYNLIGPIGDQEQSSAANQPLALVHNGVNYAWIPGVAGNNFTTPNNANNDVIGNFGFEVNYSPNFGSNMGILCKGFGAGVRTVDLSITSTNNLRLRLSAAGTTFATYTSTATTTAQFIRVSRNSTTGIIKFFTSTDGITYTQLGADVAGITGNLFASTDSLFLGINFSVDNNPFLGTINSIRIFKDDTFTTATQIFNPQNYNRATSQTTWTSTTGEVWTLTTPNSNNALKAAIVDRTMIMGNGTTYGMRAASLNMNQSEMSSYTLFRKFVNTAGGQTITELGAGVFTNSGFSLAINFSTNLEAIRINGNIGLNDSNYSQNNLGLKLATGIYNIANAIECQPYLINNVSATFISQNAILNNTAAMNGTGYNLLATNNAASAWANVIFCGDLVFSGEDNSTVQTAMYNAIKTFTNGI